MPLKNPFGLTLELGAAEELAKSETSMYTRDPVSAYPGDAFLPRFELPDDDDEPALPEPALPEPATAPPTVRMRFRDSAMLRHDGVAGFALPAPTPPAPAPAAPGQRAAREEREARYAAALAAAVAAEEEAAAAAEAAAAEANNEDGGEEAAGGDEEGSEGDAEINRLNYFVHNGYRYDGDIFELRPPQERSIGSRPERILEHKPAVLNHRQIFNRVYSEGTYNNRPSSLRQLRLSARLSAASWASVSELLAAADLPPAAAAAPSSPPVAAPATPERARQRIGVLVQAALVTEEQAQRIALASADDELARAAARAPRLTHHIDAAAYPRRRSAERSRGGERRKKGRRATETVAPSLVEERAVLRPVNAQASPVRSRGTRKMKSPKKKTFWKTLVHL